MTTTCSTRNLELVTKEFGADVAVDYTQVCQGLRIWSRRSSVAVHCHWLHHLYAVMPISSRQNLTAVLCPCCAAAPRAMQGPWGSQRCCTAL